MKIALLIGINYKGTEYELSGCINDTLNIATFLKQYGNYDENDIIMMNDSSTGHLYPTKSNIIAQLNQLLAISTSHQQLIHIFIAYSGHGTYVRDRNNDEADRNDEAICPIDFQSAGFITDDFLFSSFIRKFKSNTRLTVLIDACNSGTALDLKFNYRYNSSNIIRRAPITECNIVMISGCLDYQLSSEANLPDATNNGEYESQGAMTAAFLHSFVPGISHKKLLNDMRMWLASNKFTQKPQLSSGRLLTLTNPFNFS